MSAILDCKLLPSWANSQMGPDRFEIVIPKLTYKSMSCFYHSFEQSYNLCAMTNRFHTATANHEFGGHLGFENIHQCHK